VTITVLAFAELTDTFDVIERAVSFDERLEAVWPIKVEWNDKLKVSYGRGGPTHYGIKLHPALRDHKKQLRNTFLHELAHCMEYILYKRCGHSQTFWEAMIRLGEKPWEKGDHEFSLRKYNSDQQAAAQRMLEEAGL
jgi:predicted SprT family Zn-dependent metalloprotease